MFGVDFLAINTVRRHLAYYGGLLEFVTLKHLDVLPAISHICNLFYEVCCLVPACLPPVIGTSAVASSAVPYCIVQVKLGSRLVRGAEGYQTVYIAKCTVHCVAQRRISHAPTPPCVTMCHTASKVT